MTVARGVKVRGKPLTPELCERARRLYQTYDWNTACEVLGIASSTMAALRNRNFQPAPRRLRPIPHDFKIVADGMTQVELMRHYNATGRVISRWRSEVNYGVAKCGPKAQPVPDDFVFQTRRFSRAQLAERYGVSIATIGIWRQQTGTRRQDLRPEPKKAGWADSYFERAHAA